MLNDPARVQKIKENAQKQFTQADRDGSGYLDNKEFATSCRKYNQDHQFPEPSDDQVQQALVKYDKNKDGKLSLEEYQNMIIEVLRVLADMQ